jgi:riboflavin-specific deaminase-like protein
MARPNEDAIMRRLHPSVEELDLDATYAGLTLGAGDGVRAGVALGMVSSVDGAAALTGRTAALGGPADRVAFGRLRAACDAILVGAGTVRDEHYGPPGGSRERRADRLARGLPVVPRLVIVTGRLALEPDHRVFGDPSQRPLVVTTSRASEDAAARLAPVADVVRVGDEAVDLPAVLEQLADLGLARVLCEGGPSLNAALLDADLVDEVFLTLYPALLGGVAPRIVEGDGQTQLHRLALVAVHEHDGELLLRYRRQR